MGRASSSKKVARASRAAGRPGARRNLAFPAMITAIVLLGFALIALTRFGADSEAADSPAIGDHWHAAYGVRICGEWQASYQDAKQDESGIHSHADGLIHIHPFSTRYTGDGANLAAFADQVGMKLEDDRIELPDPDGDVHENGDRCGERDGIVQVKVWEGIEDQEGHLLDGDFADFAPQDGDIVTIAFAREGADLPQPPSVGTQPTDLTDPGATAPSVSVPDTGSSSTSAPPADGSTSTSVAGETTTTVPAETTTTAAP